MNEGSEGMCELENDHCYMANKFLDVRPASCVQVVYTMPIPPALGLIHCLTIFSFYTLIIALFMPPIKKQHTLSRQIKHV